MPPEPTLVAERGGTDTAPLSVGVVIFAAAVVATGVQWPRIGSSLIPADLLILALMAISLDHLLVGDWRAGDVVRRISLALFLIAMGTLIGSFYVGAQGWIFADLGRDLAAIIAMLSGIEVLRRGGPNAIRAACVAVGICIVAVTVQLIFMSGGALRSSGTFANPNIAAHLLAVGLITWTIVPFSRPTKLIVYAIGLVGMVMTGSFGAILQLGVGIAYLAVSFKVPANNDRSRRRRSAMYLFFAAFVLLAIIGAFLFTQSSKTGLNQDRLERSASLRFLTWNEALENLPSAPFGVGPGSVRALDLNMHETELHSEPLAFLIERGVIGLVGLVMFWVGIWRLGKPGGVTRALLLAYVVGSLTRETSHYRHFWLFLAIAIAFETLDTARPRTRNADIEVEAW